VSAFWAQALDHEVSDRWQDADGVVHVELDGRLPAFGRPVLLFQPVQETKTIKNRVHVDVVVGAGEQVEEEIGRLTGIGATVIRGEVTGGNRRQPWALLADPEGNEFCVRFAPRHVRERGGPVEQSDDARKDRTAMTSEPVEPAPAAGAQARDVPAGDLGVGGPADRPGPDDEATTPPEYPESVDPAEGPLAGRDSSGLGDLRSPGPRS
jgi:hypothetical protein